MVENYQEKLFRAMADPAFYPHDVQGPAVRDTHISKVFLTGQYVYKIKKPVNLGFVDFRTLKQRQYYCEQEILLNRRLTEGIYLAVVPVSHDGQSFQMNGPGQPVEYAVRMRQLPIDRTMGHLLKKGAVSNDSVLRLAAKLADFHRSAPPVFDPSARNYAREACVENFRHLKPYIGSLLDSSQFDSVRAATFNFFMRNKRFFDERLTSGRYRDGHGDLRSEHVYLMADRQIQILDCIEFNNRLRFVDTASDLSFLVMDLEYHQWHSAARGLLEHYCRDCDDQGLLFVMDFYKCYRAIVRCKVNCLTLAAPDITRDRYNSLTEGAKRYLDLAHCYARRFDRPTVWVFCGLPATGKSALSRQLADILFVSVHNSDRIRKRLHGLDPLTAVSGPTDTGIYASETGARVYERLLELARKAIREGSSVVLDATYSNTVNRSKLRQMVADCGARILFIECQATDEILCQRLKQREKHPSVSDARTEHFTALKERFEPLTEIPDKQRIRLDTTRSLKTCIRNLLMAAYLEKATVAGNNRNC